MKPKLAAALVMVAVPAAAGAMPVSTFLAKAEALRKKGPLALFSGDIKLLMGQVKQDAAALRDENKVAEAAGRRKAYCTPPGGVKMSDKDIMAAMNAVPPPQRASTHTKDALRAHLVRRFPCRG